MKPILISELNKRAIDIPKLVQIIVDGKPKKKWGFIEDGYEDIGLFTAFDNEGNNIFHILAARGVLSTLLPFIFDNESKIFQREKVKDNDLIKKFVETKNLKGLTPIDLAVKSNDPKSLEILYQKGIGTVSSSFAQNIINNDREFLSEIIKQGCVGLLELISVHANMLGILKNQIFFISKNIQLSKNTEMRKFFSVLFEFYWSDILADKTSEKEIISKLLEFVDNYKDWDISLKALQEMFGTKVSSSSEKVVLSQIKHKILNKVAEEILNNRNLTITDDQILDKNFKNAEISEKIVKFIVKGEKPEVKKPVVEKKEVEKIAQESVTEVADEKSQVQEIQKPEQNSGFVTSLREVANNDDLVQKKDNNETDIHQYVIKIEGFLKQTKKTTDYIDKYLGQEYTKLQFLIAMSSYLKENFDKILGIAANNLKLEIKNTTELLTEYVNTLSAGELLSVNSKNKTDAYNLACIYDHYLCAKLILERGFKVGIYQKNTNSIFDKPIDKKSAQVLKYLLTEQKLVELDWQFILSKAIKYANLQVAKFFAESDISAIETTTDRKGTVKIGEKYTVFNKILDSLVELSEIERYKQEEHKKKAMIKIPALAEFLEVLLNGNKIYFSKDPIILKKTFNLMEKLNENVNALKIQDEIKHTCLNLEKIMNHVQVDLLKIDQNFDIKSETTYVSHISALSDVGRDNETSIIGSDSSYIKSEYTEQ